MTGAALFSSGAGFGFSVSTVGYFISGGLLMIVMLWGCWVLLATYRGFSEERVNAKTFSNISMKVILLIVLFIWIAV
jgi:integrating conjugative element protein (TIGR03758 family)